MSDIAEQLEEFAESQEVSLRIDFDHHSGQWSVEARPWGRGIEAPSLEMAFKKLVSETLKRLSEQEEAQKGYLQEATAKREALRDLAGK